jgi:uncharacterized protein (TIGR02300 family)
MSIKAERGTKRVCQSCNSKFYDLNRDPITCPMCQAIYQVAATASRTTGGNNLDADDDAVLDKGRIEFVPLDEVAAREGEDLPDIEGGDIADAGVDDEALDSGADDEPFLEEEDEGNDDVAGLVTSGKDEEV